MVSGIDIYSVCTYDVLKVLPYFGKIIQLDQHIYLFKMGFGFNRPRYLCPVPQPGNFRKMDPFVSIPVVSPTVEPVVISVTVSRLRQLCGVLNNGAEFKVRRKKRF